jgi:aspartate 1-decarboxylase
MFRRMLKGKIHRLRVTEADLNYVGSITLDPDLMEAADILPYEQVHVLDIDNGNRLTTYAIPGEAGSGEACINGAAAHLVHPGDLTIVLAYADYTEEELRGYLPRIVHVDERNRITSIGPEVEEVALSQHDLADLFGPEVRLWVE